MTTKKLAKRKERFLTCIRNDGLEKRDRETGSRELRKQCAYLSLSRHIYFL